MHSMSSDSVKKRSSSSCARRRSMNMPIWLPTLASIESRSASGSRISRLKNSITLRTSPRSRTGNPNAAWSPSRAATSARGKFASWTTSGIQAGSACAQTRPGRPIPRANVVSRLAASNRGNRLTGPSRSRRSGALGLAVDLPERAVLPAERLADRLENLRRGFGEGGGLDQRAGDHVLGRQSSSANPLPLSARAWGVM